MFAGPQMLRFYWHPWTGDKWFSWNSKTGGIVWIRDCATEPTLESLICLMRSMFCICSSPSHRINKYPLFPQPSRVGGEHQGLGQGLLECQMGLAGLTGLGSARTGLPSLGPLPSLPCESDEVCPHRWREDAYMIRTSLQSSSEVSASRVALLTPAALVPHFSFLPRLTVLCGICIDFIKLISVALLAVTSPMAQLGNFL